MIQFPFGGLWFAVACIASMVVTVAAWRAGDSIWIFTVIFGVFAGVMAFRRFRAGDL